METLATIGKLIGLVVFGAVVCALVFFFAFWFFIAFAAAIGLFLVVWALGIPITIKERGVKTGYVRWFKFYPVQTPRNY